MAVVDVIEDRGNLHQRKPLDLGLIPGWVVAESSLGAFMPELGLIGITALGWSVRLWGVVSPNLGCKISVSEGRAMDDRIMRELSQDVVS